MKISTIKRKFKNTWVLAWVLKQDKLSQVVEAEPVASNRNRTKLYEKLSTLKTDKPFMMIYTGKISGNYLF